MQCWVSSLVSPSCPGSGLAAPSPTAPALPVTTANCSSADLVTSHQMSNMTRPDQEEAPEYFYLYRISYAIGFMITVLVGIIAGGFIGIGNRNVMV